MEDRVELKVLGLSQSMSQTGVYALILADANDTYRIPIVIGMGEAQSITIQLEHLQTQRPLTHDLMKHLLDGLHVQLEEVYIYRWEAGVFYASLLFRDERGALRLDGRTSDAVALALRFGSPIYVARQVVEQTAITVPLSEMMESEQGAGDSSKTPASDHAFTAEELQRLMNEAVKNEDYENASRFRDMLKAKKRK